MTTQGKKLHLQGLRTVAIISVVLFHFFPKYFPNGYLGVDQFFLLSGYLMTMMLERSQELSFSSVGDFFYRRVKRIVPLYYLVTLIIIGLSFTLTPAAIRTNYESAVKAILFATNLIRPTGVEDYAERLGLGIDMFTHTWSLSVEMQYYFLVPVIFCIVRMIEGRHRNKLVFIISLVSFYFHATSDSFLAFYSVGARIWQFIAGMMIFYCSTSSFESPLGSPQEEKKLLAEERSGETVRLLETGLIGNEREPVLLEVQKEKKLSSTISLFGILSLLFYSQEVSPLFGRVVTILLTSLIVHEGESSYLLENRLVVFLGEISYGWYLVHWPIVAMLKMNKMTTDQEMLLGMLISLLISVVVHFSCERQYLSWGKATTAYALGVLLALNGVALWRLGELVPSQNIDLSLPNISASNSTNLTVDSRFIYPSDSMNKLIMGYENKTAEERAKMNDQFDANDASQIRDYPCIELPAEPGFPKLCQMWKDTNATEQRNTRKLLIAGNSYAGNVAKLIFEECRDHFAEILVSWTPSCEVLVDSNYSTCIGTETIKNYNPDVMLIIDRHLNTMSIVNGTNPFNDRNFESMIKRVEEIEKHVKDKIYVLDALPRPFTTITETLNNHLRKGINFQDEDLIEKAANFKIAKERIRRLELGCEKCQSYDYEPYLFVDGLIRLYDPENFVSFFTRGLHLSPVGLERIRPLYRRLCRTF